MQLTNQKTGVVFTTRTTKHAQGGFAAIVTRREGKTEFLAYREIFHSRAKAYIEAKKNAFYSFKCHCNYWGA